MKKGEFLAQIKRGEISPLYLFLGEKYEQEKALKTLKDILFKGQEDLLDFNYDLLYGDEIQASSIIDLANTFPLKSQRRLVIVRGIDQLPKREREILASHLDEEMPSFTCLVTLCEKLEGGDPFYRTASRVGEIVNFWPPFDKELPSFLIAQARERNKGMDIEAAKRLIEVEGNNLSRLSNELDKLILYVGERNLINVEDVTAASGGEGSRNIFDLLEAIAEKNVSKGLMRFHQLFLQGEAPLKILFMIIRELRLIYQIKFLSEEGKNLQEISTHLGISSKKSFSRLMRGTEFFKRVDLERDLKYLLEADIALKSQERQYHPLILELLIVRLCGFAKGVR